MVGLYPEIAPHRCENLAVDDTHILYVEECGSPNGIPVIFLHGGPGAGCEPFHRRFFNPRSYRIVLFDQRGCGRSTPHAELEGNTTQTLVADMELIRQHLGIERWVIFGGSWGSTLALIYAQTYPERVLHLILRGIFLCRPRDIYWFYQDGASQVLPDYWQDFLAPIAEQERDDLVSAYYRLLTGSNEIARMSAAKAWSIWEGRAATLQPRQNVLAHFSEPRTALSLARIECHYFNNSSFLMEDQIRKNADYLQNVPGVIVHGRYDIVCPVEQAWLLHQAWPRSELHIVPDAGHSAAEPGIVEKLIQATNQFAENYR
jgi:proline iminopeptidase